MIQNALRSFGFFRRRPWVSRFRIGGRDYGGAFDPANDPRLRHFAEAFPAARRVLELGSLEGAHTFALAAMPGVDAVVGIEGRLANLKRARFVQRQLGVRNVSFVRANLESFDPASLGPFDAVFCSGLLYHLPRPWTLLQTIAGTAPGLLLATHVTPDAKANEVRNGYSGSVYREFGHRDPLSGLSPESFWPTLGALKAMLADAGFRSVVVCDHDENNPHGPLVTLAAKTAVDVRR
ncbi:MAG TPA: class I SAM-dependent methyltransferase [Fimbriiglobus sp.]